MRLERVDDGEPTDRTPNMTWIVLDADAHSAHPQTALVCGLCWIRTSDLCDVNAAL
jgi:hypothetical protein